MLFLILKWLHVLAAIAAVGSNITYGIWIAHASRNPEMLPFTLRGIKWIDDRVANPAYGVLLITGLLMAFVLPYSLTTPWLLSGIVLYAAVAVIGIFVYSPVSRRQIEALDSGGFSSPTYKILAQRGRILGMVLAVLTIIIVFLMVVKPALWA